MAADNTGTLCWQCHRDQQDQLAVPPVNLGNDFWQTDAFVAAFESHHIGRVIKVYRNHARHLQVRGKALSQDVMARWLGLNQGQISKLENGDPEDNLKVCRRYAEALHIPHGLLWFDFPGESRLASRITMPAAEIAVPNGGSTVAPFDDPPFWQDPSFDARLESGAASSGQEMAMLAASESSTFGLRHQVAEIHASTMEQIQEEVRRLSVDFIESDPLRTFVRSRRLRNDIFALLEQRALPQQEQELYGYAARTCGYLAAASSDFYGRYDAATDQCRAARRFADVAGFGELRAWVLGLQSGIAFWRGDWKTAANLAERSLSLAVTRSGVMRATSMRARALARLGNINELKSVIAASEASSIDSRSDDESGMILFSESNHLRCIGTANLWAGESRRAQEQLVLALDDYLANSPDNHAVIATIRADIAISYLDIQDVEGAAESLNPLLGVAPDFRLEGVRRRLVDMRARLSENTYKRSSPAQMLNGQIAQFLLESADASRDVPEA